MRTKLFSLVIVIASILMPFTLCAQTWSGSTSEQIRTLRMTVNGDWLQAPVIGLGTEDFIELSFDEMSHDYHRYTYHIEHCNALWEKSDLLLSDYLDGFDDETIDEWQNSRNTTFDYTHYTMRLPNEQAVLKLSGNYRVSIMENGEEVAWFRFCVAEQAARLTVSADTRTDIDYNDSHCQLRAQVSFQTLNIIDPSRELLLTAMQNLRFDNAVQGLAPDFMSGTSAGYQHCKELIFPAGNEFRRFEITDMYTGMMNVDRISWHEPYYHASLDKDLRHHAYNHDSDHNGRFLIRTTQGNEDESDTEADYVFVHFTLDSPELDGGSLYVGSMYGGGGLDGSSRMEYDHAAHAYTLTQLMKHGAYDYQYLWVPDGETAGQTARIDGDWYETGNEYLVLLYLREFGSRYDRLVGVSGSSR